MSDLMPQPYEKRLYIVILFAQQLNYSRVLRNSPSVSVVQYGSEITRYLKDGSDRAAETEDLGGASTHIQAHPIPFTSRVLLPCNRKQSCLTKDRNQGGQTFLCLFS